MNRAQKKDNLEEHLGKFGQFAQ